MLVKVLMLVPLALLIYLPGWATLLLLGERAGEEEPRDGMGLFFTQSSMGLAAGGIIALALALAGWFSGWLWSVALLTWTLIALAAARPRLAEIRGTLPLRLSSFKPDLPVLVIMLLALAMFLLPFMNVFGHSDEGVYPNIAAHIKNEGSVMMTDAVMRDMEPGFRWLFYYTEKNQPLMKNIQEPGFFVKDFDEGKVVPQFVFFYPALLAVFMGFLGMRAGFMILPLFAVLSVLGIYLVGRELAGRAAGLLAALFMSLTVLQVYFSKYSSAEMATQFFFIFAMFALLKYNKASSGSDQAPLWAYGTAAAAGFTGMMLAHVESFFILAPLIGLALFWFVLDGLKGLWNNRYFLIPVSVGSAAALIVAFSFSHRYTRGSMWFAAKRLPGRYFTIVAAVLALVLAAVLLRRLLDRIGGTLLSRKKWMMSAAALALLALTAYTWFIRPALVERGGFPLSWLNSSNLSRLAYFLTPLGVVLAVAGYCLFIVRRLDGRNMMVVVCGLFFSALFLYRINAVPQLIYSMRRFVPVAVPVALLMIACLVVDLWDMASGRLRPVLRAVSAAVVVALVAWSLALSLPVFKIDQTRGSLAVVHRVSDIARRPAVIVSDQGTAHLLAAPLRNFFGRDVAGIRRNRLQESPRFEAFLRSLKGKDVYYVTTRPEVPEAVGRFPLEKVGTVEFEGTMFTPTVEKPAVGSQLYKVQFYIYRMTV